MTAEAAEKLAALYLTVVKEHVNEERVTKASLEQRGLLVITTSGTLVTLQFAVGALRTRAPSFTVPAPGLALLLASLGLFLVAAVLALIVNLPKAQLALSSDEIGRQLTGDWHHQDAVEVLASLHLSATEVLRRLRDTNRAGARLLVCALAAELTAVTLVGAAVAVILTAGR
ncbi:hypothetical protein AB0G32_35270 [Streptomyces sp. NPDC023723]|uniref:hypothetical protein n=1 Tax=Streptomyces sp. NPDC023723 TaxID=3154323 RepID=UPI0033FF42AD